MYSSILSLNKVNFEFFTLFTSVINKFVKSSSSFVGSAVLDSKHLLTCVHSNFDPQAVAN
jgi:hypothetical protein